MRNVPVSGAVITDEDINAVVETAKKGWFTEGEKSKEFAKSLRNYVGTRHASLCNSGSSANLLALTALISQYRNTSYRNYVVTCATGFPTTIAPIVQNRCIPLFVDADPKTLNPDTDTVLRAINRDSVIGVILAHTLGFPFDAKRIREECDRAGKFLIEDCADALGTEIYGQKVGSFGHASTFSFFPAHHITTGEGGAVLTNDGKLFKLINSYRDWGRDCFPAGTLIRTSRGHIPIEDVKVGDYVFTHKGRFEKVKSLTGHKNYQRPLVEIDVRMKPKFIVSSNHMFWTKTRDGKYCWVEAGDLWTGDCLVELIGDNRHFLQYKFEWSYETEYKEIRHKKEIELDLLRLMGYWLAEGSLASGNRGDGYKFYKVEFAFHQEEVFYINDVVKLMKRYFGVSCARRIKNNGMMLSFKSRDAYEFFSQLCGVGAFNKSFPSFIENLPSPMAMELIKGYWRGDGSKSKQGYSFHSISRILIEQVRIVLLKAGILCSHWARLKENHHKSVINGKEVIAKHDLYNLNVYGINAEKLSMYIDNSNYKAKSKRQFAHISNINYPHQPHALYPVRHVQSLINLGIDVYNLEVEKDNSYHANGLAVHNCWCSPGESDTCNKRFSWKWNKLPQGWDHKYTFTNLGYNLKMTELQAALGLSQIQRIDKISDRRFWNFYRLWDGLKSYKYDYILELPYVKLVDDEAGRTSPFGFPISVTNDKFTKQELISYLEQHGVKTRPVFAGNITRHPMADQFYYEQIGILAGSDFIMENTFWIGCHDALTRDDLDYVVETFYNFFREKGLI